MKTNTKLKLLAFTIMMTSISLLLPSCSEKTPFEYKQLNDQHAQFAFSKKGVDEFYDMLITKEEFTPILKKENCYNVTTNNIEELGIEIFKFSDECESYLKFKDEI